MSGKPAARQGDMTQYGGPIVQGSAGVRIGAPTGVACSVCPGGVTSGNPVNPLLGAKVLPGETDFALPGPLPFILSRTYSSYRTKTPAPVGIFGPGWKAPSDIHLQLRDNELILNDNGGRSIHFEHLFPGEDGFSRSELFWLVRGGVAKLNESHRLAPLWQALPEELRLSPHIYLATNSPQGPWWILGWSGRVQTDTTRIQTVYQPGSFTPLIRIETENGELDKAQRRSLVEKLQQEGSEDGHGVVFPVELVRMLDRLEGEIRANCVSSESRQWLAQCGLTVEWLAAQIEPVYLPERKVHLYHCDHRGLPLALISEDGNTMWSAEYDEWGNLLNEENPHHLYQPYRLPGQQYDDESGLCYNRNRYYDPLQGRYITQDPIGLSGGWNLYQYPLNPVHKVDPLGLSAWDDAKSGACHEGICRLFSVFIGPDKFDSTDDAAFEALKKTNGHSICQGVEHAGLVCKDKNNKYFYTPPKQGNVNTSYPFESPCPNGTETVAMYHTHGSDSNGVYGDEVFSPADKELSKNKAISSYLGTPKGSFQKVEPNGDQPMNKSGLPSQCRVHANGEIY
ncbi:DUF4329 domain-containing protein [Escherichia coli]